MSAPIPSTFVLFQPIIIGSQKIARRNFKQMDSMVSKQLEAHTVTNFKRVKIGKKWFVDNDLIKTPY